MIERIIETILFSSRWLLAPFYLGLVVALFALLVKFVQEIVHGAANIFTATESDIILATLTMIDITFTASLIVIVIFSGYENFVSKIDPGEHADWPDWMGKIDFAGLKLKLMSSIVAISAIQLLKAFMNIRNMPDRDLYWFVGIHMVFVVSGLLMALTEKFSEHPKPGNSPGGH